ncbi:MAG TPA: alkaline phosphatase family protein [Armatimonadota bacterium]|nr:alkaline phosphatase family protein [Armatimonadota bacterium]
MRAIILGMDGLDPNLLEKWWDDLPNFRRLRDEGMFARVSSVFPPDSVPAWASIYTGLSPDHHGILDSIDYLDAKKKDLSCDTTVLTGNTFWDTAGRSGKRVCVINPFLAYPVWPVNGIMVNGPVFVTGDVQSYPESVTTEHQVPELGGIVGTPTKKTLEPFREHTWNLTLNHLGFAKELFAREKWGLFFMNFLSLDRIQHSFWRFCDPADPTYPGKNPYSEVIADFYRLHDRIVGEFLELMDEDCTLIVLSDHGHGMRCTKAFYVNEFLRRQGLLRSSAGKFGLKYLMERAKSIALRTLDKYDLHDLGYKIGGWLPGAKALKKSTYVIDKSASSAQVARFSGMNPYGGIELPRSAFQGDDREYDEMVGRLIKGLLAVEDPHTRRPVVRWAKRREEMFDGPYAYIYPEVVFQLDFEYGVGRSLFGPLIDVNPSHRKVSGGHMPDASLLANRALALPEDNSIVSTAEMVLGVLGVDER